MKEQLTIILFGRKTTDVMEKNPDESRNLVIVAVKIDLPQLTADAILPKIQLSRVTDNNIIRSKGRIRLK
jgi:hypothetical protein